MIKKYFVWICLGIAMTILLMSNMSILFGNSSNNLDNIFSDRTAEEMELYPEDEASYINNKLIFWALIISLVGTSIIITLMASFHKTVNKQETADIYMYNPVIIDKEDSILDSSISRRGSDINDEGEISR